MIRDEPTPSLDDLPDVWDGPEPDARAPSPRRATEPPRPFAEILAGHVLIPAATILMVSSLLFYFYDVRSVFLPGARQLKWLGFWFVVATVLIARFGKQSGDHDRRRLYTGALALATIFAMIQSPWEAPEAGVFGALANSAIVLVVWRFASELTRRLSADLDRAPAPRPHLYGLARLEMERLERERGRRGGGPASVSAIGRRARAADPSADPSSSSLKAHRDVARLILAGLGLFALGEPFLLTGPPAAGQRALGAMLVFLLSAGCVLAAAAAHRASQRAWRLGATTSATNVAGRVGSTAVALVLVLVVALGMPGLNVRGSGERVPVAPPGDGPRSTSSDGETSTAESTASDSGERSRSSAERADDSSTTRDRSGEASRSASAVVETAASLGDWIRWPLLAAALLALAWLAVRHARVVARGLRALRRSIRRLLRSLRTAFRWPSVRKRSADSGAPAPVGDPLADLGALEHAPPRSAVLEAYARLRAALTVAGSPPPPGTTPAELVARWPAAWRPAQPAARRLTELAQRAAWSDDPTDLDAASRRDAVAALVEIRTARDRAAGRSKVSRRGAQPPAHCPPTPR